MLTKAIDPMLHLVSTYRIQFHKGFTFDDLKKHIPYLRKLGVQTLYASPVFTATPGSTHGYDGLNPHELNPEIGTAEGLREISRELKSAGIHWLQDIVPNHMAFDHRNAWLRDVLEKGRASNYASFFDIHWESDVYEGRLMVPFLGATTEEAIEKGELTIAFEAGGLVLKYYVTHYPLHPASWLTVLNSGRGEAPESIKHIQDTVEDGPHLLQDWDMIREKIAGSLEKEPEYVKHLLQRINEDKEFIRRIESAQAYHLCHWQETDHRINFRRFFTVNGLICLNIQDEEVFATWHRFIASLLRDGIIQGLRVDHIDGLYDPTQYLQRLRELAGDEMPIYVEKILEPGEDLPGQWPIEGNTGYDFLSLVNNLFTSKVAANSFNRFYRELSGDKRSVHDQIHEKKEWILNNHMRGELENLCTMFRTSGIVDKKNFASIRPEDIREAIGLFLVHCPVYRYYGTEFPLDEAEATAVQDILKKTKRANPDIRKSIDMLEHVLLHLPHQADETINRKIAHFYLRCMQFTGPLMAKGVEDTLMYTYHRFIGHNEVGDSPESFGILPEEFHKAMKERQKSWPLSLNATSTHDTKRGEDVRARLNVLTDIPDQWINKVKEWRKLNAAVKNERAPDANDEYFIYQTLAGAFPFDHHEQEFEERISAYLEKAMREAKVHSNWTEPDEAYESAVKEFARSIFGNNDFKKSFISLIDAISDHGILNALSQLVLKFTCPGIPDVYQGSELWDFSLVDPDNRRPVDFDSRQNFLDGFAEALAIEDLWKDRRSGKIKLWLVQKLMNLRKQQPDLFASGEYIPLTAEGKYKDHVVGFARKHRHRFIVVAVPLHTATICEEQGVGPMQIDWKDTRITIPGGAAVEWRHTLQNSTNEYETTFELARLFRHFPLALLSGKLAANERGAGILLHISSLPSPFGVGDLGPEAKAFADFLAGSYQKFWQLLPLNPIEEGQGHSPYSSISSRAGNVLFISPELLVHDGLLHAADLATYRIPATDRADFEQAEKIKAILFEKAWIAFRNRMTEKWRVDFESFKEKEKAWLDDFARYTLLKGEHGGRPWYEWDHAYRMRDQKALQQLEAQNSEVLEKIKWLQFIFSRQWHALRDYCNGLDIQLIGDLPFYVSYDSADVWANRHLFALDEEGRRTGLAGVPPDAFSADGQLWGMPVFNWEAMEKENFQWWIDRLKKNMELFDIVRLDHFRAFSAYWEVPADAETARTGTWKKGPGSNFFKAVKEALGELPFVAEDLGEIDDEVYQLRDEFGMPGMKVLQFAFGGDMPRSVHIPHNYSPRFIVYTGTHDNNTTRGWFMTEAGEEERLGLETYIGRPVSAAEVSLLLARMAYGSVAASVILPIQDLLNLDETARMNIPASGDNNWRWRLVPGQLNEIAGDNLKKWTILYNRE